MAEFAHYNHEDSDDDAPAERPAPAEHTSAHTEAEHPKVPAEQEGTIFSRDKIASDLSRPLFDFIRKQEQPEAHAAERFEPISEAESLPSVSNPSEPETRTYQPPVEAEVAQAIHEQAVHAAEDDDDDEAADDSHPTHAAATPAATPAPAAPAPKPALSAEHALHIEHAEEHAEPEPEPEQPALPRQEHSRPLSEQFEEIMHAEMGEDFNRMASGEHLGETEDEPNPNDSRTFVANWPHQQSEFAEPEQPESDGEPDAFYYAEAEPAADSREPTPFSDAEAVEIARSARMDQIQAEARDANTAGAAHGARGGAIPPLGGTHGVASGGMSFGGGLPTAGFNAAPVVALQSPLETFRSPSKPEKSHKGRYFVAGFITGWAVKQHLANKKMQKMNQEHQKAAEAQQQEVDSLKYQQHDMGLRLKQTEGRLQEAEATATRQATRAAEAQTAEAPLVAPAAVESVVPGGQVAARAAEAVAPQRAAEQQAAPVQESAPIDRPNRMESTPLQYAAAAAEIPFAAASAAAAAGAAERAPAPFAVEAQKAAPVAERPPKTPAEEAAALVEQAYQLQSGEHIEHATGGGHNIIVDSHGHEVQGAMVYGEEFKFQQRQEQVRAGAFDNSDDARKRQADNNYDAGIITGLGGSAGSYPAASDPRLGGGTPGSDKRLPLGIPNSVNPQHLLRARNQNPLVATVASPWLWASVVVLIVAFFVAAFI
jgi:hypothetical protein